jgi:hypothetical protein
VITQDHQGKKNRGTVKTGKRKDEMEHVRKRKKEEGIYNKRRWKGIGNEKCHQVKM